MNYSVGSLIRAREREWVVLPGSSEALLMVRPVGGADEEITGILTKLEPVEPASFDLPDPTQIGDYRSCRFLRDALRIGFRSSAGPFRSLGKIAAEPRPYQLAPLLMALKLDPVRILIADDVGIGKTIEAALIARELLDRGEVERLAVLCPPQLAEQWQKELREKFHIEAELVLSSTASRLERHCRMGESIFDRFPFVVVSMDFIKPDRRRDEFLRACPDLVIVDEAHTCAFTTEKGRGRHQRHQLVSGLAANPNRHLILVTATPHSGKEEAFRSLLAFLKSEFANLPPDLTGKEQEHLRREVAQYFVQRKRGDIRAYLGENTRFPERIPSDETYKLSDDYRRFFERVLRYARETVKDTSQNTFRQRVKWWSALALLRSLASSPAAAAATLRTRAAGADTDNVEEADEIGRSTVLDLMDQDSSEGMDMIPGSDVGDIAGDESQNRRRLLEMAREAERLQGEKDFKLQKAVKIVKELVQEGFQPIVFCRFIPTVEYVSAALREALPKSVEVMGITGLLPPAERETRVEQLGKSSQHVLVCTDCLSEGINLQEHFNAVMHYDLSWNPTRHEQREGRVDRFGQPEEKVAVITYYGIDNQIDGVVLDVLLKKHKTIRSSLGVSVPVPANTDQVIEAIFEGLLLREKGGTDTQLYLPGFEELFAPQKEAFHKEWDVIHDREKRSRTMFAQAGIKVDEVNRELQATRQAIGSGINVAEFVQEALRAHGAAISNGKLLNVDLSEAPTALRDTLGNYHKFKARFDLPVKENVLYLNRTHPLVENLAAYVLDTALDPVAGGIARRCGVIRAGKIQRRTTLLLTRFRFHIITLQGQSEKTLLAEDCQLMAFSGSPQNPEWLNSEQSEALLDIQPEANVLPEQASHFIQQVIEHFDNLRPHLETAVRQKGAELLEAHQRVRQASRIKGVSYRIEPVLPPDVLGIYVYLPV